VRSREGSILEANIHFADELFEASDAMKKMLLGVFDENPTYEEMGRTEILEDLLLVMSASNRLPGPEDAALGDRLLFQLPITKLPEREDRREIITRHLKEGTGELSSEPQATITVAQVKALRAYSRAHVTVPEGVQEKLLSLDFELDDRNIYLSPRSVNRCLDILRATALLDGRTVVTHKDLLVLQYVVASPPQQPEIRDLIYNLVAPLERNALGIFDALKKQVGEWRALANSPDKRLKIKAKQGGQDLLNDVADYKEQLDELALKATDEGYDAEAIENMAAQVENLHASLSVRIRELYKETAGSDDV
jgi:MoxR-like ATPase